MTVIYRELAHEEIARLRELDRTEVVGRIYHMRDGALVLEDEPCDVPDWSPADKEKHVGRLRELAAKGATFLGAFAGQALVGLAVLDHGWIGEPRDQLDLAQLYVSRGFRDQGVGRALTDRLKEKARALGAKRLYVSATPSEHTVRFYRGIGFELARVVDPALFAREPEDIHMELTL